jgi:hypothetical protein
MEDGGWIQMECGNNIPVNLKDQVPTGLVHQQAQKDTSTVDSMEKKLAQDNAFPTRTQLEDAHLVQLT